MIKKTHRLDRNEITEVNIDIAGKKGKEKRKQSVLFIHTFDTEISYIFRKCK